MVQYFLFPRVQAAALSLHTCISVSGPPGCVACASAALVAVGINSPIPAAPPPEYRASAAFRSLLKNEGLLRKDQKPGLSNTGERWPPPCSTHPPPLTPPLAQPPISPLPPSRLAFLRVVFEEEDGGACADVWMGGRLEGGA